jgi:hypothetical protein
MRTEDVELPVSELIKKYPDKDPRAIVLKGWK